jgi:hypothetical protein
MRRTRPVVNRAEFFALGGMSLGGVPMLACPGFRPSDERAWAVKDAPPKFDVGGAVAGASALGQSCLCRGKTDQRQQCAGCTGIDRPIVVCGGSQSVLSSIRTRMAREDSINTRMDRTCSKCPVADCSQKSVGYL